MTNLPLDEIFLSLEFPKPAWPRLANYLRSQLDLAASKRTKAKLQFIDAVSSTRVTLLASLERHEASRFWDTDFLYVAPRSS